MRKKVFTMMLISMFSLCFMTTSYGENIKVSYDSGAECSDNEKTTEMTTEQMIDELYANISNEDIRNCAKKSSMILTGELSVTDFYGRILIDTYQSGDVYHHTNLSIPLGAHKAEAVISDKYTMTLTYEDYPTPEKIQTNKAALSLLYDTVKKAKTETESMNDTEKALYLAEFVKARLSAEYTSIPGNAATVLMNGKADCDGYSGLYCLLAVNCGLNVKNITGTYSSIGHAWNEIELDGAWKVVDLTSNRLLITIEEASSLGYVKELY